MVKEKPSFYQPEILFGLARNSIEKHLGLSKTPEPVLGEIYDEKRATFVTLNLGGKLRGCIGSLAPYQSLADDIRSNAHSAAFSDHRFSPLSLQEYSQLQVEISILSIPEPVIFVDKEDLQEIIEPGRDGIVFTVGAKRATFLPQVWEQLPEFDQFFSGLSLKAGLGAEPDFTTCSIERYSVDKYREARHG